MKKSNFALITALYTDKSRGLYKDIYFPIIRYSILKIFGKREEAYPFATAEQIEDTIQQLFGIKIPSIVIAKSIMKISNNTKGSIDLMVYEGGSQFRIQRVSADNTDSIEKREQEFIAREDEIERKFQDFLSREGKFDDGTSFLQFITSNTDELLEFFNNDKEKVVDKRFFSLVEFLRHLSENDKDLYQAANNLFWGSIIAAYLQSDKPKVSASENSTNIEYYLDTPLVLGILGLSTPEIELYSRELRDIILSAKGILRIHPVTLEEIKSIISSSEQNGSNPFSDIASAIQRKQLTVNDLASKRLNLEKIVEAEKISIKPLPSEREIQRIRDEYKSLPIVKALEESRSFGIRSYSKDRFREIHDVFMDNFIIDNRKKLNDDKHLFFVTNNIDLIKFCKNNHKGVETMLSTTKVILDLWIYNSKSTEVSDCALAETMAKCADAHKIDVRNNIAQVKKYYNQTKGTFDEQVYADFVRHLNQRAKNVINFMESSEGLEEEFSIKLTEAVAADNSAEIAMRASIENDNRRLQENINQANANLQISKATQEKLKDENKKLEDTNTQLKEQNNSLASNNEYLNQANQTLNTEKIKLEKKLTLKEEKEKLQESLTKIETELNSLIKEKERSFINIPGSLMAIIAVLLFIFVFISLYFMAFRSGDKTVPVVLGSLFGVFVTAAIVLFNSPNICKLQDKAYKKWECRHPRYNFLLKDKENVKKSIDEIAQKLRDLD